MARFLASYWRDILNFLGLSVTLFSLWLTYRQSKLARTAAEAAEDAAERAASEARDAFRHHSLGSAIRVLDEIKIYHASESWHPLTLKLSDLATHLSQIADPEHRSRILCAEARVWETIFRSLSGGRKRYPKGKWIVFLSDVQTLFDSLYQPFPESPEGLR